MKDLYEILQETVDIYAAAKAGRECEERARSLSVDAEETLGLYGMAKEIPEVSVLLHDVSKFAEWASRWIDGAEEMYKNIRIDAELCGMEMPGENAEPDGAIFCENKTVCLENVMSLLYTQRTGSGIPLMSFAFSTEIFRVRDLPRKEILEYSGRIFMIYT